jgi:hypothetical protein
LKGKAYLWGINQNNSLLNYSELKCKRALEYHVEVSTKKEGSGLIKLKAGIPELRVIRTEYKKGICP